MGDRIITPITIFATIFSVLSITLSVFEHISASVLLQAETVLVIKMDVNSIELSNLTRERFKQLQNLRGSICNEISKIIDIDSRMIELLTPIQTRNGVYFTFYIRSDASQAPVTMQLIKTEAQSGTLAKVSRIHISISLLDFVFNFFIITTICFVLFCRIYTYFQAFYDRWNDASLNLRNVPKIGQIETKEIKPDINLLGESSGVAAVISMDSKATTNSVRSTSATPATTPGAPGKSSLPPIGQLSIPLASASQVSASVEMKPMNHN